ncbi:MAG: helix-turn-helix transcriptional regulator, partial [Eubacteriales bacterium]
MEVNYQAIGNHIRNIRKAKKISQEKLAEMSDYSVTHISHIETGSAKASIEAILKVSAALGCTPNDILCDSMAGAKETFLN